MMTVFLIEVTNTPYRSIPCKYETIEYFLFQISLRLRENGLCNTTTSQVKFLAWKIPSSLSYLFYLCIFLIKKIYSYKR